MKGLLVVTAVAIVLGPTTGWTQDDAAAARIRQQLRKGDRVTLALDSGSMAGRLDAIGPDGLVVRTESGERRVPFAAVSEARRTRRGFILGTVIGAGIGVACGAALASYAENEGGNKAAAYLFPIAVGAGAGAGIDALLNLERTVYRREAPPRLSIAPSASPHGAGVGAVVRW
jgi:hypothetical protein